jgi:hypothetical protein
MEKELQQKSTGQILISEQQRHIQHYEKIITEYKQNKRKLNKRELQMVLMNLSDLYSDVGEKEKSEQYQNELKQFEDANPEIKMSEDIRKDTERSIEEYGKKLKEYRKNKRDYRDAYLILMTLMADYNRLRQRTKVKEYLKELETLKTKHSDLVSNPPQELSGQRKIREEFERKKEELRKKPFAPKDDRAIIYWYENKIAAVYQYRIEFYELPKNVELYFKECGELPKTQKGPTAGKFRFARKGTVKVISATYTKEKIYGTKSPYKLNPKKTIKLRNIIQWWPDWQEEGGKRDYLLICTHPMMGYAGTDNEEQEEIAIRLENTHSHYPWKNPEFDFENFCGIISIDGNIIFQLPIKQETSNSVAEPFGLSENGKKAILGIGKVSECEETANCYIIKAKDFREILIWDYPDKISKISVSNPTSEVIELLQKYKKYDSERILNLK